MSTNTMENIIKEGLTPIGVQENEETFGLSPKERSGILHLFGRSGQGKSVTLEDIVISDIHNGRGGMLIDPYGDLIKDIQAYIPADKTSKVAVFDAQAGTLEENIAKFQQEIHFEEMKKDDQKFLLCKLDYRSLGKDVARELGLYLVKQFLQVVGGENRSLGLDEAHNFVDEEVLEQIVQSKEKGLSCILSDQTSMHYRTDILERTLEAANHVLCYFVDSATANLINKYHTEMSPSELTSLEKYNFIAKVNTKTASPTALKLKGVFPIPYPKK
ncbi:hypothetical protein GF340_05000 [Candidatus Peregrinibacteria bacterium]|nr:hypothetical protein [Candidatus Peregrinibacteria bacterium]